MAINYAIYDLTTNEELLTNEQNKIYITAYSDQYRERNWSYIFWMLLVAR